MLYDCSGGLCNLFTAVMTGDSQPKSYEGVVLSHGYFTYNSLQYRTRQALIATHVWIIQI